VALSGVGGGVERASRIPGRDIVCGNRNRLSGAIGDDSDARRLNVAVGTLVWPVVARLPPGIRSFAGHTDTVPDMVGRFGAAPSLVIFTEADHLMAPL